MKSTAGAAGSFDIILPATSGRFGSTAPPASETSSAAPLEPVTPRLPAAPSVAPMPSSCASAPVLALAACASEDPSTPAAVKLPTKPSLTLRGAAWDMPISFRLPRALSFRPRPRPPGEVSCRALTRLIPKRASVCAAASESTTRERRHARTRAQVRTHAQADAQTHRSADARSHTSPTSCAEQAHLCSSSLDMCRASRRLMRAPTSVLFDRR